MCPGDQSRPPKCDVKLTPTALPISSATALEITVFADQGSEMQSNFRLYFLILISKVAGTLKGYNSYIRTKFPSGIRSGLYAHADARPDRDRPRSPRRSRRALAVRPRQKVRA